MGLGPLTPMDTAPVSPTPAPTSTPWGARAPSDAQPPPPTPAAHRGGVRAVALAGIAVAALAALVVALVLFSPDGGTPQVTADEVVTGGDATDSTHAEGPSTTEAATPPPAEPDRLRIDSLGVDADVIDLGLDAEGALEVPRDFAQTGWWTGGAVPGEDGPAVIVGHVDSVDGPAVFFRLDELAAGDEVTVVGDDGTETAFVVERSQQVDKDEFPTDEVYGPTDDAELRLVTCGGEFDDEVGHYDDNVIVFLRAVASDA